MNTDNDVWNALNRMILAARPAPKHRVSLGDWMDPAHRAELIAWAAHTGYELVIDATDLGEQNDQVRDMETLNYDKLENGRDDFDIWPKQGGGAP